MSGIFNSPRVDGTVGLYDTGAQGFHGDVDHPGANFNGQWMVPGIVYNYKGGYASSSAFGQSVIYRDEVDNNIVGGVSTHAFFESIAVDGSAAMSEFGGLQIGSAVVGSVSIGIAAGKNTSAHGGLSVGWCRDPLAGGTIGHETNSFNYEMNPFSHDSVVSGKNTWSDAARWAFTQPGQITHRMRLSHLAIQNGIPLNQFWISLDPAKYPQRADNASSIQTFPSGEANPYYVPGATPAAFDDPKSIPNFPSLNPLNPNGTENIFYTRIFLNWYDEKLPLTSDKQRGHVVSGSGRFINGDALQITAIQRHPDHIDGRWRNGIVFNNDKRDAVIGSLITATKHSDGTRANVLMGVDFRNVQCAYGSIRAEGFGVDSSNNAILRTVNVVDGTLGGAITLGLMKNVDPELPESATNTRSMPDVYPKIRSKAGAVIISFSATQHLRWTAANANVNGTFASI